MCIYISDIICRRQSPIYSILFGVGLYDLFTVFCFIEISLLDEVFVALL